MRRHFIIAGPGRSGTSFLMELLTLLGANTGFSAADIRKKNLSTANAGLEKDVREALSPYVCKDPKFFEYAFEVFTNPDIKIDAVLIPIREVGDIARSRSLANRRGYSSLSIWEKCKHVIKVFIAGLSGRKHGLVGGVEGSLKESTVIRSYRGIYELVLQASRFGIDIKFLVFPDFLEDPEAVYEALNKCLDDIPYSVFYDVFLSVRQGQYSKV